MSVKLLTREDIEDAKTGGAAKRKERYSFFSQGSFQSDAGRGGLYLTGADDAAAPKRHRSGESGVRARAFVGLSARDKRILIETNWRDLITRLKKPRKCAACGEAFTFFDQLGRRQCAWHPGKIGPGERWTCCGKNWNPEVESRKQKNGCCACDHNGRRPDPADRPTMKLPLLVALYAGVPRAAISDRDWVDLPMPNHECVIEITTVRRFANGFTYAERPFQYELIERPLPYRADLLKGGFIVPQDLMQLTYEGTIKPVWV